jgi:hypothetical protein
MQSLSSDPLEPTDWFNRSTDTDRRVDAVLVVRRVGSGRALVTDAESST